MYHPELQALIRSLPDTRFIRTLMLHDLKRQYNCCHFAYNIGAGTDCDSNCNLCPYYGEGWLNFRDLIRRLTPPAILSPRDRVVQRILTLMLTYINTHDSCSMHHKAGTFRLDPILGIPDCEICMAYHKDSGGKK